MLYTFFNRSRRKPAMVRPLAFKWSASSCGCCVASVKHAQIYSFKMEPILHFFCGCLCFIIWIVPLWSKSLDFTSFGESAITSIFAKGWDSLGFSKKNGEKKCEHWSENEFTSFGENAITSIFAKGWNSLGFSKKMVKKTAKIDQKMNSVSYLTCTVYQQLT